MNKDKKLKKTVFPFWFILFIIAICLLSSILFAYPLWWLATKYKNCYTALVLTISGSFFLFFLAKKFYQSYKKNKRAFLFLLIRLGVTIIGGVSVLLLFSYNQAVWAKIVFFLIIIHLFIMRFLSPHE